jgi:aldehyde dehydrogenase (NAD+)
VSITSSDQLVRLAIDALAACGAPALHDGGAHLARSPITGATWRTTPAPRRGELVRLLGELLRAHKALLGPRSSRSRPARSRARALGEVQEMIDICDFAVGLSRQLHGLTIASERPGHRMMEQWHPLGPNVGVITAFNFPVAVWAWNAALALVCGNTVVWKPSELTPLTALATACLLQRAARAFRRRPGTVPEPGGARRRQRWARHWSLTRCAAGERHRQHAMGAGRVPRWPRASAAASSSSAATTRRS